MRSFQAAGAFLDLLGEILKSGVPDRAMTRIWPWLYTPLNRLRNYLDTVTSPYRPKGMACFANDVLSFLFPLNGGLMPPKRVVRRLAFTSCLLSVAALFIGIWLDAFTIGDVLTSPGIALAVVSGLIINISLDSATLFATAKIHQHSVKLCRESTTTPFGVYMWWIANLAVALIASKVSLLLFDFTNGYPFTHEWALTLVDTLLRGSFADGIRACYAVTTLLPILSYVGLWLILVWLKTAVALTVVIGKLWRPRQDGATARPLAFFGSLLTLLAAGIGLLLSVI